MKLNPGTVDYTALATTAAGLDASLQDLERGNEQAVLKVAAEETRREEHQKIQELEKQLQEVLRVEERRDTICWTCGYRGHRSSSCRASPKTVRQYNRSRSKSGERRSPSPWRSANRSTFNSGRKGYGNTRRGSFRPRRGRFSDWIRSRSAGRSRSRDRYEREEEGRQNDDTSTKAQINGMAPYRRDRSRSRDGFQHGLRRGQGRGKVRFRI